jgi:hypothetical protein
MALFSTSWTDTNGTFQSGSSLGVRTYNGTDANGETRTTLGPTVERAARVPDRLAAVAGRLLGGRGVVAGHGVSITAPMRPVAASDFNAFSGKVVVDWVRNTPYVGSGSFVSRVFDGAVGINWTGIAWTADLPDDTSLAIAIRTWQHADSGFELDAVRHHRGAWRADAECALHPVSCRPGVGRSSPHSGAVGHPDQRRGTARAGADHHAHDRLADTGADHLRHRARPRAADGDGISAGSGR